MVPDIGRVAMGAPRTVTLDPGRGRRCPMILSESGGGNSRKNGRTAYPGFSPRPAGSCMPPHAENAAPGCPVLALPPRSVLRGRRWVPSRAGPMPSGGLRWSRRPHHGAGFRGRVIHLHQRGGAVPGGRRTRRPGRPSPGINFQSIFHHPYANLNVSGVLWTPVEW